MNLTVDNFAFINHASVKVDGITVIAGPNDSGKSTIGKILFSIFHALKDVEEKIAKQRVKLVYRAVQEKQREWDVRDELMIQNFFLLREMMEEEISDVQNKDEWNKLIHKYIPKGHPNSPYSYLNELKECIFQIVDWPKEKVLLEFLQTVFQNVFNRQVASLNAQDLNGDISLLIKEKTTRIQFSGNTVDKYISGMEIANKVVYLSTPLVIDLLNDFRPSVFLDATTASLIGMLQEYKQRISDTETALVRSINKEKLKEIFQLLDEVIPGDIVHEGGLFALRREGFSRPIMFDNLSMGIKAFTVIKMLVEADLLKKKDVLVLDEPEIHLHPTWQIAYAHIIVLLQKFFDLSIVITTHSHFFLKAIDIFTQKYGLKDKAHFYLSEATKQGSTLKEVEGDLENIYAKMADAVHMLRKLQNEL